MPASENLVNTCKNISLSYSRAYFFTQSQMASNYLSHSGRWLKISRVIFPLRLSSLFTQNSLTAHQTNLLFQNLEVISFF